MLLEVELPDDMRRVVTDFFKLRVLSAITKSMQIFRTNKEARKSSNNKNKENIIPIVFIRRLRLQQCWQTSICSILLSSAATIMGQRCDAFERLTSGLPRHHQNLSISKITRKRMGDK